MDNPLNTDPAPAPADPAPDAGNAPEPSSQGFHSFINEDLSFKDGYVDAFKAPDGEDPNSYSNALRKFTNIPDLVKGYANLQHLLGKEKIPMPGENADPSEWDRVYDAMGRPNEAKYELGDGVEVPEDTKGVMDAIFHEAGLSQRQADKLYAKTAEILKQSSDASAEQSGAALESAIQSLEQEVGPRNSQGYAKTIEDANIVAEHLGLDDPEFFKVPGFAAKMAGLRQNLIDSKVVGAENSVISASQNIDSEIRAIQNDPNHRLYAAYARGDQAAHQHVMDLIHKKHEMQNS